MLSARREMKTTGDGEQYEAEEEEKEEEEKKK